MKIDTTRIENYDQMSPEEKRNALEAYEFEGISLEEANRLKAATSKANSEAAESRRARQEYVDKWKASLDEAKRAQVEREEHDKEIAEKLASYERKIKVGDYLPQYLTLGYDKDLALKAAEASADGDAATIIACQHEFLEAKTKELEAAALNKQPTLSVGSPPTSKTAEVEAQNKLRGYFGLPPIK